ncbi:Protein CBR-SRT-55 [Caenorhabditis briggsae]|uniref:Protein CBR-SRT-55 n=2 Tax=Caenorhabditis briggsae TaxID=6238 RepID=A8X9W2_CAEBR|nr:Protein CBR-SRT-55 [Caenorhabditis briggsae]CAP29427.2 Protein CBR-SRT-55 [Caenorhabditis briggsae]
MKFWILILCFLFIPPVSTTCYNLGSLQCWPEEIQEMILMISGEDTYRYNCSGKTDEEWYKTGVKRVGWGIYYVTAGIFFQLIGWPVLYIFLTKFSMTHALKVYRVMVFIGLIEITEVWGNSIWPGIVAIFGEVYCTSPRITTIAGKITMVQWVLGSSSAVFLGLHRITDLSQKGEWLVNTNLKTSFWLALLSVYSIYGSIFYDTILFNSQYMAPIFNPMTGQEGIVYSNNFLYFHNIIVSVLLISVYTLLCYLWMSRDMHASSHHVSKFQRSILYQSICISLTYAVPACSFASMFLFTTPAWFFHASDITYQLSGGLPFIMYISLNQKVQDEFLDLVGICPGKRHKAVAPTGNSAMNSYISGTAKI